MQDLRHATASILFISFSGTLLTFSLNLEAAERSCTYFEEIKVAKCASTLAVAHFVGSDGTSDEFPGWENACDQYRRFQQCTEDVPAHCRDRTMPKVQRVWSAVCAQKSLFQRISEQSDCFKLIETNSTLQECFRKHTILSHGEFVFDNCFYLDGPKLGNAFQNDGEGIATVQACAPHIDLKADYSIRDLCPIVEKRFDCFANYEDLKNCQDAARIYRALHDILAQKVAKPVEPKPTMATVEAAETTEATVTTTTVPTVPKKTTTTTKPQIVEHQEDANSTIINPTINERTTTTTATTKPTTTVKTTKVAITTTTKSLSVETTVKSATTKSATTTHEGTTKATTTEQQTKSASPKTTNSLESKRTRRDVEEDLGDVDLKCSYRSVDEMVTTYWREKEERALGGCFEANGDNSEFNSDFVGITIQPTAFNDEKNGSAKLVCGCIHGYRIDNSTRKCVDVDECEDGTHRCSHTCINRKGGYDCACESRYGEIYQLSTSDNRTCVRNINESAAVWLIFAHGQSIWNVSDDGRFVELKLSGLEKAAMLDVDVKNKAIYFVDSGRGLLEKFSLDSEGVKPEIVQSYEVDGVEGIAVDYISGWLFGSDWSSEAFIYRAAMDGSRFEKIITTDIVWPNGLTVDHYASRLYWADAFLDIIQSTDFDGSHRRTIVAKSGAVTHLFGLAVADNFIYWTDWNHRGILRADKLTGGNVTLLAQTTLLPYGIRVYHPVAQPAIEGEANPCDKLECDHLCLRRPAKNNSTVPIRNQIDAICACASGYSLEDDGRTCKADCREPAQNVIVCGGSEPKCVNKRYVCDGILHCPDRMDERNCPERICPLGEFQCADEPTKCLDASAVCDGHKNCGDASDERFCDLRKKKN